MIGRKKIRNELASLNLEPRREAEIVEEMAKHLDERYEEPLAGGATTEFAVEEFVFFSQSSDLLLKRPNALFEADDLRIFGRVALA